MQAYRLSKKAHQATAFSGEGARLAGGRWNFKGERMVYCSDSRALAAMELFVNLDPALAPGDLVFITVDVPDALIEPLGMKLPSGWRSYPAPDSVKKIGSAWLANQSSVGLLVPSVVMPQEQNLLLNPDHPEFKQAKIGKANKFEFDSRMFKSTS